jgi:hypothetical protein
MSVTDHVQALKQKHVKLETELGNQECRPMPDTRAITDLKRQKLAIKDKIVKLSRH